MKKVILFIIICSITFFHNCQISLANIIHVSANGSDERGDGSELKPFSTIQFALNQAKEDYTINVAEGTFYENIVWPKVNGIKLIGKGEELTIIDGGQKGSVVRFEKDLDGIINNRTLLQNLSLQNGKAEGEEWLDYGGGIFCHSSSPTIKYVTILNNSALGHGGGIYSQNSKCNMLSVSIIGNSTENDGAGIFFTQSDSNLYSITINDNTAKYSGGGIRCSNSNITLSETDISKNTAKNSGGGLYIYQSDSILSNVTINENTATYHGGGLMVDWYSEPKLSDVVIISNKAKYGAGIHCSGSTMNLFNVTIKENIAELYGGGVYFLSSINFDNNKKSRIFSNLAKCGKDVFNGTSYIIHLNLAYFTVKKPTSYYASPIQKFTYEIDNSIIEQKDFDLYVSPSGDNTNKGDSPASPLKNIHYALSQIQSDENSSRTIYLSSGTYSQETNDEKFPLYMVDYVNIEGQTEESTILKGNQENTILYINNVNNTTINNLYITNGKSDFGGGINILHSSPNLMNITITKNEAEKEGGGIYCQKSTPIMTNVSIINNHSNENGGGLYCNSSDIILSKVNIASNSANHEGGGIYSLDTNIDFNSDNSIFYNQATFGWDVYSNRSLHLVLDFFTVKKPTSYYVSPISNFTYDIQRSKIIQKNFDLYVSPKGSDTNVGNSTLAPLKTISYALSVILADKNNHGKIYLDSGVYSKETNGETFPIYMTDYVTIEGKNKKKTILDASYENSVVYIKNVYNNDVMLKSITITHGSGGIYCKQSKVNLKDITISNNYGSSAGGGIYCERSILNLSNVIISKNTASVIGGGIYYNLSDSNLTNVYIAENTVEEKNVRTNDSEYNSCKKKRDLKLIITIKTASNGGGICSNHSNLFLDRVTIYNNSSYKGAAVYGYYKSNIKMYNVTTLENSNYSLDKGVFDLSYRSHFLIHNNIFWGNSPSIIKLSCSASSSANEITVTNSLIQNGQNSIKSDQYDIVHWKDGNSSKDPLFLSYDSNQYQIRPGSPCIDASSPDTDGDGLTWVDDPDDRDPDGSRKDIGAIFYRHPLTLSIPDKVLENDGLLKNAAQVSVPFIPYEDITIQIASNADDFIVPQTVIIPAKFTATTFDLTCIDSLAINTKTVTITADSPYFLSTCKSMIVVDSYIRLSDLTSSHSIQQWTDNNDLQINVTNSQNTHNIIGYSYLFNNMDCSVQC